MQFHRIDPDSFAFLPKKLTDFLYSSVRKSPTSDLTVEDALTHAKTGTGDIYAVMQDRKAVGAVFFMYGKGNNGSILDVALVGGEDFKSWKQEIREFTIKTAKTMGCSVIWGMGRGGWLKVFPEATPIGVVYEYKIP